MDDIKISERRAPLMCADDAPCVDVVNVPCSFLPIGPLQAVIEIMPDVHGRLRDM
jgi:hypothetical protein